MVWPIARSATMLPSQGTTREYWFSTVDSPLRQLQHQHVDRLKDVQRLESRHDDWLAVVARDELIRAGSR